MPPADEAVAECPSCGAIVSMSAAECPKCGELFADEALAVESVAKPAPSEEKSEEKSGGFREKLLFYLGLGLIVVGGPGIALGSWLHDILRISVGEYDAFEVFGGVNRFVAAVGLIVLVVGIVFLILSLRLTRPVDVEYDLGTPRDS